VKDTIYLRVTRSSVSGMTKSLPKLGPGEIPPDGYWKTAGQVFSFPMVTVFAANAKAARAIAGEVRDDEKTQLEAAMDSAIALSRLGLWGRPDLAAAMMRGD